MWQKYLERRKLKGYRKEGMSLFCLVTEAIRVVNEKDNKKIWITQGPYREALAEYIGYLEAAATK
jgi:hypothetical protein